MQFARAGADLALLYLNEHEDAGAAQPEEGAPAWVLLASHACASDITGIVLQVTGSVEG